MSLSNIIINTWRAVRFVEISSAILNDVIVPLNVLRNHWFGPVYIRDRHLKGYVVL